MILRGPFFSGAERQHQRRSAVVKPDLRSVYFVPVTVLTFFEKKVYARSTGATFVVRHPCFSVMAALGVRREPQMFDYFLSGHGASVRAWAHDSKCVCPCDTNAASRAASKAFTALTHRKQEAEQSQVANQSTGRGF